MSHLAHHHSRRTAKFVSLLLSYLLVISLGSPFAFNRSARASEETVRTASNKKSITAEASHTRKDEVITTTPSHVPMASSPQRRQRRKFHSLIKPTSTQRTASATAS